MIPKKFSAEVPPVSLPTGTADAVTKKSLTTLPNKKHRRNNRTFQKPSDIPLPHTFIIVQHPPAKSRTQRITVTADTCGGYNFAFFTLRLGSVPILVLKIQYFDRI